MSEKFVKHEDHRYTCKETCCQYMVLIIHESVDRVIISSYLIF